MCHPCSFFVSEARVNEQRFPSRKQNSLQSLLTKCFLTFQHRHLSIFMDAPRQKILSLKTSCVHGEKLLWSHHFFQFPGIFNETKNHWHCCFLWVIFFKTCPCLTFTDDAHFFEKSNLCISKQRFFLYSSVCLRIHVRNYAFRETWEWFVVARKSMPGLKIVHFLVGKDEKRDLIIMFFND